MEDNLRKAAGRRVILTLKVTNGVESGMPILPNLVHIGVLRSQEGTSTWAVDDGKGVTIIFKSERVLLLYILPEQDEFATE